MKGNMKVEDALSEQGEEARGSLTRRGFVAAAVAGIGAVAVGSAASCSSRGTASGGISLPAESSYDSDRGGSVRAMPANHLAQSLIAAVAPRSLAALADSFATGECPQGLDAESLLLAGSFSALSLSGFKAMVESCSPDVLVYASHGNAAERQAFVDFAGNVSLPYVAVDLDETSFSEAARAVAKALSVDENQVSIQALEGVDKVIASAASVASEDRFLVYAGGGDEGFLAYGPDAPANRMLESSGSIPLVVEGIYGTESYIVDSDSVDGDDRFPEIVFLLTRKAGQDYVGDRIDTVLWQVSTPGRAQCVFPALAGGVAWIGEMSEFAMETIGAAWIASLLYPSQVGVDADALVKGLYSSLFGAVPSKDEFAQQSAECIAARLPVSKADLDSEMTARKEANEKYAQEMVESLHSSNDVSNYSDEELYQVYTDMCEAFGREPNDEDWHRMLAQARGEN